ncbi:MAG: ATP-binding cassette domain-containing protein [Acidobacteriia bacterium]|nr:ATP-binding cassette domain-containing protein [Terriglobia bacterium]
MTAEPDTILEVVDLQVHFPILRGVLQRKVGSVKAVDGVSFEVRRGETLGVVGESGSGKTTLGRAILKLVQPTAGQVLFEGQDLCRLDESRLRQRRRSLQMIFQDPYSSLNPRMRAEDIVSEPLIVHGGERGQALDERTSELFETVGLDLQFRRRYPHELSGGQRQRLGIARALALNPSVIVCDEPVSALDVSIQAQIVNLLKELQRLRKLTYLFIAHDLSMVRHISDRVAVMYLGRVMELAARDGIYNRPLHPYTVALLSAAPLPDPDREAARRHIVLTGGMPNPADPPPGCVFSTRCPLVKDICHEQVPELRELRPGHFVACHRSDEAGPGSGLPPIPADPS